MTTAIIGTDGIGSAIARELANGARGPTALELRSRGLRVKELG